MPSAGERRLFAGVAAGVILADLATKLAAQAFLASFAGLRLLGDWVQLRLVYNPGAAFGVSVGPASRWVFLLIALGALVVLERLSRRAGTGDRLRQLACGLVAGGAAGNLIDRLRSAQGVVDFLDVGVGTARWPTFNVADMGVTIGAFALAWSLWREDQRSARAAAPESVSTP
ncbi:MAG: signal peptidase II [Gemmatimonadales bacterium]